MGVVRAIYSRAYVNLRAKASEKQSTPNMYALSFVHSVAVS